MFVAALSSCGEDAPTAPTATAAPLNEVDLVINDYEKLANQYISLAKRLKGGDMGVTIPYIQTGESLAAWPAKLQQVSAKMTPPQAQRVAEISARVAPYLQK